MIKYRLPYQGKVKISLPFGVSGSWSCGWHVGLDLVGLDSKIIYPIAAGTVKSINAHGASYGNHVTILHEDGTESLYAHLSNISVKKGRFIAPESLIGTEGATGNASGSHLHLEIHRNGYLYPPKKSTPVSCTWVMNPAEMLGIENKKGVVVEMANNNQPSAWAKEAWQWAKDNKILDGTRPKDNITREELAAVAWSLALILEK